MGEDNSLSRFYYILRNCETSNAQNLFINKISKNILRGFIFYGENKKQ